MNKGDEIQIEWINALGKKRKEIGIFNSVDEKRISIRQPLGIVNGDGFFDFIYINWKAVKSIVKL